MRTLIAFLKDENGAAAAEYALILAIVGGTIAVAMGTLGADISSAITKMAGCIANGTSAGC